MGIGMDMGMGMRMGPLPRAFFAVFAAVKVAPALANEAVHTNSTAASSNRASDTGIQCFPYKGCGVNSAECPACALGPSETCTPTAGISGRSCSCTVHRALADCEYGHFCYQRCVDRNTDYVFAVTPIPDSDRLSTLTTSTATLTTSTSTTMTASTSTITTATATSTTSSTQTSVDPSTLNGASLRKVMRELEDSLIRSLHQSSAPSMTQATDMRMDHAAGSVAAYTVIRDQQEDLSLPVPKGNGTAVIVPRALLSAMNDDIIVSIAAFNSSTATSFEATELNAPLAVAPLSVRLISRTTLEDVDFGGSGMPAEIKLELMWWNPVGCLCAYWDAVNERWSGKGLRQVPSTNGTFICATSHLTIFAAILGAFEREIQCSNAHVMNSDGLIAITRGDWWSRPPALVLWAVVLIQLLLLCWAIWVDFRAWYRALWRDEDFLTTNVAFQGREAGCLAWLGENIRRYLPDQEEQGEGGGGEKAQESKAAPRRRGGCCGRFCALLDSISLTLTADCAHYQVARSQSIAPEDLRDIVLGAPSALEQQKEAAARVPPASCTRCERDYAEGERFCAVCGHRRERPGTMSDSWRTLQSSMSRHAHGLAEIMRRRVPIAVQQLATRGICMRLWAMFAALHPWVQLQQYSITLGTSVRCLLLTAKLLGALMLCCLFFDGTSSALAWGSSAECERQDFWAHFWRNVFLGLLSSFLSLAPLIVMWTISNRRFIYQDSWEREAKRGYVQCWRMQDGLLIIMALIYCGFCILFCMAFLASIDESAEGDWLTSVVVVLIREFILMPLLLAAVYALVATCVTRRRPSLDRIGHKVEMSVGLDADADAIEAEEDEDSASEDDEEDEEDEMGGVGFDEEEGSEHNSWGERELGEEHFPVPRDGLALAALGEDDEPPQPLEDMRLDDVVREAEATTSGPQLEVGTVALPHVPVEPEITREVRPPPVAPCKRCGSRLWASMRSEICPMCGNLLKLQPAIHSRTSTAQGR